jgi:hypothetical protein
VSGWTLPSWQVVHAVLAGVAEYVPAAQLVHTDCVVVLVYVPG